MSSYKLIITKRRGTGDVVLQFSELNFYDANKNKIAWDVVSIDCNMSGFAGEEIGNIVDGSNSTKFCTGGWGSGTTAECIITINVSDSMERLSYYSYVTGNDSINRDPISWSLYYSEDGDTWEVIDVESDVTITTNRNAETSLFKIYDKLNYVSIEDIVAGIENAKQLRTNTKSDDETDTITGVDWFSYDGIACSNIYANGNSWIGLGASSEHLKVNRRDAAMWNLWREEGTIGSVRFLRIRWSGYTSYNSTSTSALLTYDVILFETGDIQLYIVDIPTSNYDGTFTLGNLAYEKPTVNNRWVAFRKTDSGYEVAYEPLSFYTCKYLVRNDGVLYTVVDGALSELTGDLTAELFQTSGIDTVPDGALLLPLSAPEVLCWTDAPAPCTLTATVQGVPTGAHTVTSDHIQVNHPSIYGISSVVATASDGATFLLSFDGGAWMAYTDNTWSASDIGMTAAELMAIPSNAWSSVINSAQYMQLKATLEGVETVTQVVFNYNNESPTS